MWPEKTKLFTHMKKNSIKILLSVLVLICFHQLLDAQEIRKNRVIILTDVENEPDDSESLVRLLLYSNVIDIKGIIATTSVHMKKEVHPETIREAIQAFGKVQANLLKHEAGFPDANSLLQLVTQGLPEYGMSGVGAGKDSQGSEWIIKILDENDPRPLGYVFGADLIRLASPCIKSARQGRKLKPIT